MLNQTFPFWPQNRSERLRFLPQLHNSECRNDEPDNGAQNLLPTDSGTFTDAETVGSQTHEKDQNTNRKQYDRSLHHTPFDSNGPL